MTERRMLLIDKKFADGKGRGLSLQEEHELATMQSELRKSDPRADEDVTLRDGIARTINRITGMIEARAERGVDPGFAQIRSALTALLVNDPDTLDNHD